MSRSRPSPGCHGSRLHGPGGRLEGQRCGRRARRAPRKPAPRRAPVTPVIDRSATGDSAGARGSAFVDIPIVPVRHSGRRANRPSALPTQRSCGREVPRGAFASRPGDRRGKPVRGRRCPATVSPFPGHRDGGARSPVPSRPTPFARKGEDTGCRRHRRSGARRPGPGPARRERVFFVARRFTIGNGSSVRVRVVAGGPGYPGRHPDHRDGLGGRHAARSHP